VLISVIYDVAEIPLFHVLTAKITFGNIYAADSSVDGVTMLDEAGVTTCTIDDSCFDAPPGYGRQGTAHECTC